MRYLQSLVIVLPLAAVMAFAQDPPQNPPSSQSERQTKKSKSKTSSESERSTERRSGQADVGTSQSYTGNIVDANCSQASSLMGSSSSATPSSSSESKAKSTSSAKKDVLRHCQPTSSTTSFALLTDDGTFYKLDETGNSKVTSEGLNKKNMKASVSGSVEGDTLKVQSLTKM